MRNLSLMLRAFAGGAAVLSLVACEEVTPPPRVSAPITVVETPKPMTQPVDAKPIESPKPVEKPMEPPVVVKEAEPRDLVGAARDPLSAAELDRALKLARIAVKKTPDRAGAWNVLGRAHMARGERAQAKGAFEQAIELNPESSWAHNNLGLTYLYEGNYEEAAAAFEEATGQDAVEPYMWNNLGLAYEHLDRLEDARAAFKKGIEGKSAAAAQNLARLLGVKSIRTAKVTPPADQPVEKTIEAPALPEIPEAAPN